MEHLKTIVNGFGGPKYIESFSELAKKVELHRGINPDVQIVVVLGTFDLIHIGHARFIQECRNHGDIVIVLVDPDEAVRIAKGDDRPMIPEHERIEMVAHLGASDYVCFIENFDRKTGLWLRKLPFRPNAIVVSRREPSNKEHVAALKKICDQVVELDSQASTSTSNKIRDLVLGIVDYIEQQFTEITTSIREGKATFRKPGK